MITIETINLCAQLRTKCARSSERKRAQNAYRSTIKEWSVLRMGKARALCFHSWKRNVPWRTLHSQVATTPVPWSCQGEQHQLASGLPSTLLSQDAYLVVFVWQPSSFECAVAWNKNALKVSQTTLYQSSEVKERERAGGLLNPPCQTGRVGCLESDPLKRAVRLTWSMSCFLCQRVVIDPLVMIWY